MPDNDIEKAKKVVAEHVCKLISKKDYRVIGVGSGTTVRHFIRLLPCYIDVSKPLFIASSYDTAIELTRIGARNIKFDIACKSEVLVDGADEVDKNLNMIKGGGGAHTREKILAYLSNERIYIVDYTKLVDKIGEKHPVPLEIIPYSYNLVMNILSRLGFKAKIREGRGKIGPIITDNGNMIIDVYTGPINNPRELHILFKGIPGVVETGIFTNIECEVYVGYPNGVVRKLTKEGKESWLMDGVLKI